MCASALKIAMLGRPIMPEDVHNLGALIEILGALGWVAIALPLALLVGLLVFNLKFRARPAQAGWALLIALPLGAASDPTPLSNSLDKFFGNTPWDQRENFIWRGGALHLAQESLRALAVRRPAPTEEEVAAAIQRRAAASGSVEPLVPLGHRRNLHIILEESFWDPTVLAGAGYSADPLDPRFRDAVGGGPTTPRASARRSAARPPMPSSRSCAASRSTRSRSSSSSACCATCPACRASCSEARLSHRRLASQRRRLLEPLHRL